MLKRGYKLIISVVLVATLFIGFGSAFASAEPVWLTRAKAGIAAAMLASQLVINPVNYALDDALAEGVDPIGYVTSIQETPWTSYLEQSVIKVVPDTVYIDGVPYSDIWLGPEAAESLRLAGLDFASAYNIASNQSEAITYATGAGTIYGLPAYNVDGVIRTQQYNLQAPSPFTLIGDTYYWIVKAQSGGKYDLGYSKSTDAGYSTAYGNASSPFAMYYRYVSSEIRYSALGNGVWKHPGTRLGGSSSFVSQPFSFDYTSGVIDAPLSQDDGLLLRIPSSYTDPDPQVTTYNYDIHDLINIYPQVTQDHGHTIEVDPNLNPDFQTDIDLGNNVGDLIRTILQILDLLDNVDIEFAPEPSAPEPGPEPGIIDPLPDPDPAPDVPTSGTTIADTDWTKLDEILRWIQSTIDSIRHITESLQTMLDSLFDQLQDIIQALQSLPEQLLEDIETGPSKVFRKALDVLRSIFLPLLLPIKAMMNLWHYVVEWVTAVGTPFAWIFGIMNSSSYNLVLPIYASLAGSICIAIYKALGR